MKNLTRIILCLPILFIQACSAGEQPQGNNTTTITSKDKVKPYYQTNNTKQEREGLYEKKLIELRSQSATSKANQAIRSKNTYLMAIPTSRAGPFKIPGFTQAELDRLKCRIEKVEDFGDTIYGKNHLIYLKELRQYMLQFNSMMRLHCL